MTFEISINVTQENSSNEVVSIQVTSIQELKFGDKVAKKKKIHLIRNVFTL